MLTSCAVSGYDTPHGQRVRKCRFDRIATIQTQSFGIGFQGDEREAVRKEAAVASRLSPFIVRSPPAWRGVGGTHTGASSPWRGTKTPGDVPLF